MPPAASITRVARLKPLWYSPSPAIIIFSTKEKGGGISLGCLSSAACIARPELPWHDARRMNPRPSLARSAELFVVSTTELPTPPQSYWATSGAGRVATAAGPPAKKLRLPPFLRGKGNVPFSESAWQPKHKLFLYHNVGGRSSQTGNRKLMDYIKRLISHFKCNIIVVQGG